MLYFNPGQSMASPQIQNGFIQIATELYNALCKVRIPGEAEQVIKAIIRFTYGFNRTKSTISTKQFIQCTGLPKRSIYRGIKRLKKMNMIGVQIDTGVKLATKKATTYWLQKNYEKWITGGQKDTGVQKDTSKVSKKTPSLVVINKLKDNIWLTSFAGAWIEKFGGIFHYGKAGKFLKPLVKEHGKETVLEHFQTYLDRQQDGTMASIARFAETFNEYAPEAERTLPNL